MDLQEGRFASPCGELTVVTNDGRLVGLGFTDGDALLRRSLARRFGARPERGAAPRAVTRVLDAYFGGKIGALDDLDVDTGGTPFQQKVWRALRRIPAGRTVAVVGATGSGKTTLLDLIAGLVAVDAGSITVPDQGCVLVFQEPFLLAASIRENVTMRRDFTDDQMHAALNASEASFVYDFTDGIDTIVGERGVGLSGGQRQRIALARALVGKPAALLLDDTTSALDPGTEARVLANLRRTLTDATVVAVASRPSTIALADDVLYLVEGRVAAHGRHDELLATVPEYRVLMEAFEQERAEHSTEVPA